jgi:hypothetical protein
MKLGIMQPYFFPYLGHFALIAAADEWVVFDITQYTRKSWINRNRVLHPNGGWQYVSIPLANSSTHIKISQARIGNFRKQEQYVLGKISHYRKRAPYYVQTCEIVRSMFAGPPDDSLVSLNVAGLRTVTQYLGLPFRYRICSQLALEWPDGLTAGQWAPWICAELSADAYINPIAGRALFDPTDFANAGMSLDFLEFAPFIYDTAPYNFEKDLSILDVLMWNSPGEIMQAIRSNSSLTSVISKAPGAHVSREVASGETG